MRLGWLVASPPVFDKLVAAKYASDLSSDALVQRAIHRLLEDGRLDRHLEHARQEYRRRRDVLVDVLRRPGVLPAGASFDTPRGGFNLWLEISPSSGPSSTGLYLEAIRRGVASCLVPFFYSAGAEWRDVGRSPARPATVLLGCPTRRADTRRAAPVRGVTSGCPGVPAPTADAVVY